MKKILVVLLGLSFLQLSYADDAKERLLKEADRVLEEREKERRLAEEQGIEVSQEGKEMSPEEMKAEKERRKNMTESEIMNEEIQRIKARMTAISNDIENYNKTNEYLNNLEGRVENLQQKVQ